MPFGPSLVRKPRMPKRWLSLRSKIASGPLRSHRGSHKPRSKSPSGQIGTQISSYFSCKVMRDKISPTATGSTRAYPELHTSSVPERTRPINAPLVMRPPVAAIAEGHIARALRPG